jgi:hypothetical protein
MKTTVEKFTDHVLAEAAQHAITIERCTKDACPNEFCREMGQKGGRNHSDFIARIVHVAPITDHAMYAVALHELGHLIADGGVDYPRRLAMAVFGLNPRREDCLREEQIAWQWAMEHALCWTVEMTRVRDSSIATYGIKWDEELKDAA